MRLAPRLVIPGLRLRVFAGGTSSLNMRPARLRSRVIGSVVFVLYLAIAFPNDLNFGHRPRASEAEILDEEVPGLDRLGRQPDSPGSSVGIPGCPPTGG